MGVSYLVKEDELVFLIQVIKPGNSVAAIFGSGEYDRMRVQKSIDGLKAKGMLRERNGQLQIDPVMHFLTKAVTEAVCMMTGEGGRVFLHRKVTILIEKDTRCRNQLRMTPVQDREMIWSYGYEILSRSEDWNLYHMRTRDEIICHSAEDARKWVERWCKTDE